MNLDRFLTKTVVYPYFRYYAGLFFIILLIAVGFLKAQEHLALAYFFAESPINLLYPIIALTFLEMLALFFTKQQIHTPGNRFLQELNILNHKTRYLRIFWLLIKLNTVSIIYMAFIGAVMLLNLKMISLLFLLFIAIVKIILYSLLVNHWLKRPVESIFRPSYNWKFLYKTRIYILVFYVKHVFFEQKFNFILVKSLSLTWLMIWLYLIETVDFYDRFLGIGILISSAINLYFVFDLNLFLHEKLPWLKNLPVNRFGLYVEQILIYLVLILPETLFCLRNYEAYLPIAFILLQIIFSLSILILSHSLLMKKAMEFSSFIQKYSWFFVVLVFYHLFDLPLFLLAMVFLVWSYLLFHHSYYRVERIFYKY